MDDYIITLIAINNNPKRQFGGMKDGKPRQKKTLQRNHRLDAFLIRPPGAVTPIPTPTPTTSTSPLNKKKSILQNKQTITPQRPISPPSQSFTFPLSYFLKSYPIEVLLNESRILQQYVQSLAENLSIPVCLAKRVVGAYLKGGQNALWSDKYAPKSIQQLFDTSIGNQLKTWITSSFAYRNTMKNDPQCSGSSFINDMPSEEFSCSLHQTMAEKQWKCQALVLVGREGIGKMAAIRAVTLGMGVEIMKCSNQFNQIKYLREKHQSTRNLNVKGSLKKQLSMYAKDKVQTKVQNKVQNKSKEHSKSKPKVLKEMNSRNITGYFTPILQSQVSPAPSIHSKKIHLFHHPNQIYPQSDRGKFMKELHQSLTTSKIPFILTCLPPLPAELAKYDIIEFPDDNQQRNQIKFKSKLKKEATMREEICRWMMVISHVQRWKIIGKANKITKDAVIKQIQRLIQQVKDKQSQQECTQGPTLSEISRIYSIYNGNIPKILTFLQFYLPNNPHPDYSQLASEYLSTRKSHDLLYSMIKQVPAQQISKTQDTVAENDDYGNHHERQEIEVFTDVVRRYQMKVLYDLLPQNNDPFQCMRMRKSTERKQEGLLNVPPVEHIIAKHHLADVLKRQMKEQFQGSPPCTLKPSQLCYLPMLIRGRRSSRKDKQQITLSDMLRGSKALHEGQIQYLISNTRFI